MNDAAYAEARWAELQNQGDLAWDLDAITNRSEAIAFLKRFENRLCIYSAYVEKLYSNYSFVIPESDHGGITILPSEQPGTTPSTISRWPRWSPPGSISCRARPWAIAGST